MSRPFAPPMLLLGLTAFLLLLGAGVASSFTRRTAATFSLTPMDARSLGVRAVDTLTIDAREQADWRYVDLDLPTILPPGDSLGWDVAVQRYRVRGRARGGDLPRWYSYGFVSHLLEPSGRSDTVLADRGARVLEVLSYYCPGLEAGCLTLRITTPGR